MAQRTLSQWLRRIEALHPSEIELGLERVSAVYAALPAAAVPAVISVAGTNGKGSTTEFITRGAMALGKTVGTYTSPHLIRFNERICINGLSVDDARIVSAFECVENARRDIALTYFEFTTLAALALFRSEALDLWVLEVGLGGRLDAVNVVDADVAVITSIGLDHTDWLGDNLEAIGREKAGILRAGKTAVCSDPNPPASIADHAADIGASLLQIGRDFYWTLNGRSWDYTLFEARSTRNVAAGDARGAVAHSREGLPVPAGAVLDNLAGGLTALAALDLLPSRQQLHAVLSSWSFRGRLQRLELDCEWWLDVAHNTESATLLANTLSAARVGAPASDCYAVLGMLSDKPVDDVIEALGPLVTHWLLVGLDSPRALPPAELAKKVKRVSDGSVEVLQCVAAGMALAKARADGDATIVVTGSFHTVGPALAWLAEC